METGFIGTDTASMTPWYWVAVGSSIVLVLIVRSLPISRWNEWRPLRQITGGLVATSFLALMALLGHWQAAAGVVLALFAQFIIHILIQHAWTGKHDLNSWLRRYEFLPGIVVIIPVYAWWQILSPDQILVAKPERLILLGIIILLYISGLLISSIQWSRHQHLPKSIKSLYLCALELTPLLWVAKANL